MSSYPRRVTPFLRRAKIKTFSWKTLKLMRITSSHHKYGTVPPTSTWRANGGTVAALIIPIATRSPSDTTGVQINDCFTLKVVQRHSEDCLAMSYVWGSVRYGNLLSTRTSILPKTIRDAVYLTKALGFRSSQARKLVAYTTGD